MQEMVISERDYQYLYKMIYDASGINLHEGKKELLKAKIAKRLRATRIPNAKEYLNTIKSDEMEFAEFIDTVTTNHTYFFRENTGCEYLVDLLAPKFVNTRPIKIWCGASSTGEEPYSVTVQFLEKGYDVQLIATDLSHTVLAKAKQGVFHEKRAENVPVNILHKYFQKGRNNRKELIKIKDFVKKHVSFRKFNLLIDNPSDEYFDIIFCRNVLIYFDDPTSELVVNKLCSRLSPGGYFLVGHSESLMNLKHPLTAVRKVSGTYLKSI
ncbi:MAG: protein-glutamate O-methyltransferase CheR [Desulfobacterales bacterium]|nr:protein-glutamate O-methyltransferase CheR [Desulfobacterales bacterium]